MNLQEPKIANILLVDDKPENLLALGSLLRSPTLNIVTANSGNEALGKILEMSFACVLLDVQMPEMDGYEVARILREDETNRHLPILFITAHSRGEEEVFKGYESGAVDYLFKPLDADIVRSKVSVFAELYRRQETIQSQSSKLEDLNRELMASNADLEKFAYLASHDLKEPLRMVTSYCQLLERRYQDKLGEEGAEFLNYAVSGAKRMYELLSDVLTYSKVRSEPVSSESTNSRIACQDAIADLKPHIETAGATLEIGELPWVSGNKTQMRQVFLNLIANALKYRRPGVAPALKISASREGAFWLFRVEDNGIGIERQYFDRIFELFQRLHTKETYPGTGLGLAICRKIIERHGGKIWLESELGKGTIFFFCLLAAGAAEPLSPPAKTEH